MQTSQQGVNVDSLFGVDVQYIVPRYQRRYVWNKMNWRTLWEDILYQLDLELVETPDEGDTFKQREQDEDLPDLYSEGDGGHFTGPFVTRPISRQHLSRYEVIDGQQRLTTFQIILCVIRDICQSKDCAGLADLAEETEKLILNTETVIRRNTSERFPDPTYKFRPTDYDRPAFEEVANGRYGKAVPEAFNPAKNRLEPKLVEKVRFGVFAEEEVSRSILNAYDYFYEQIRAYVGGDYDYGKVDKLISSIKSEFELVQITLDSSDQPEKIFESLNATGRKLSEFDYVRNNLFLRAGTLKVDEDTGKLYSDIFYDEYWPFENDSNYWTADRLESFCRVFLIAKLGPYCFQSENENGKDRNAFEVYQKQYYREVKSRGIKYEFEQLKDYAESYKQMTDPTSKIGFRMQFYEDLEIPSLLPFILYLKKGLRIPCSDLEEVCTILESYIVRRMVNYGYGANDEDKQAYATIDQFFSSLIKGSKFSVENLVRFIHGCPIDRQIFGGHQHRGRQVLGGLQRTANETYYGKHSARKAAWNLLRYTFYRIEQYIASKSTLSFENFLDTPTRIMPEPSRQERNDWLSIGNLSFRISNNLSQNQVNNFLFVDTKKVLLEAPNIDFELNREICKNENWDLVQIGRRKEKLYTYFREIWPDLRNWQSTKPKVVEWHFGEIKHWHPNFSHGFIIDKQGKEIRVEKSQLPPMSIALLRGGEKVRFEKVQTQEGFRAINIELIGPEDK